MKQNIFFASASHKRRFFVAIQRIDKVDAGKLDPEYGAALYILTADDATWELAQKYIRRDGIGIQEMLDEHYFSSSEAVLIQLAGNLFNGQVHVDPLELMRLDETNFQIALSAIMLRRYSLRVDSDGE